MAADEDKTLRRIEKLLRLAAPSSNSTEAERVSAALEVAKLFDEHPFAIVPVAEGQARERAEHKRARVARNVWMMTIALQHCNCSHCNTLISRGDHVWVRIIDNRAEFRHNAGPCRIE